MNIPKKFSMLLSNLTSLFFLFFTNNLTAEVINDKNRSYNAHYENVLGTSLDIGIYGVATTQADKAVSKTLKEIQRLEGLLSSWKKDSEISQLNIKGSAKGVASELTQVISECEKWRSVSNQKFSCRMGKIKQLWSDAEKHQQVPERIEVRYQAREIHRAKLTFDLGSNTVELDKSIRLDLDGLAKGFIIDRASNYLQQLLPLATGIKLDIGGDAFYWKQPALANSWNVLITEPNSLNDTNVKKISENDTSEKKNHKPLTINLQSMAIASSGHNSRYREIERRRFSHILDPQDGWPLTSAPSATVIALDATTADAVATALSTQTAAQGIDWVNELSNVEAIIMLPDGLKVASNGWHTYLNKDALEVADSELKSSIAEYSKTKIESNSQAGSNTKTDNPGILIKYQIPDLEESKKYHKPYVAIWISDRKNKSVRNLLLLGESNRWVKENTRWWRRVGRKNLALVDGIARPTRRPGEYELFWDGLDDFGQFAQSGNYYLNIEASREGGGHDYQKIEFKFGNSVKDNQMSQAIFLAAKGEVGAVTLTYVTENPQIAASKDKPNEKQISEKSNISISTSLLASSKHD